MCLRPLSSCSSHLLSLRIACKIGSITIYATTLNCPLSIAACCSRTCGALARSLSIYENIIVYLLRKTLIVKDLHAHQILILRTR